MDTKNDKGAPICVEVWEREGWARWAVAEGFPLVLIAEERFTTPEKAVYEARRVARGLLSADLVVNRESQGKVIPSDELIRELRRRGHAVIASRVGDDARKDEEVA